MHAMRLSSEKTEKGQEGNERKQQPDHVSDQDVIGLCPVASLGASDKVGIIVDIGKGGLLGNGDLEEVAQRLPAIGDAVLE